MEVQKFEITWPGSSDKITGYQVITHSWDISNELANHLVSAKPYFFPMVNGKSVDQHFAWMGKQGDIYNAGGIRVLVRHTTQKDNLLAVAMSINRPKPDEAEFVVQTLNGYASDDVDPKLFELLKSLNKENGRTLGTVDENGVFKPI